MDIDAIYVEEIDDVRVAQNDTPVVVGYEFDDNVSDNQLVPDEVQSELIAIRDQVTQSCFKIGDIANDMVLRAAMTGFEKVTAWRVRRAVGRYCGKSERTVRYYAEVAAFYPANIRTKYEVLPFSHFVFARSMGAEWQDVLEYSMLKPEVTVEELRYKYIVSRQEISHDNNQPSPEANETLTKVLVSGGYVDPETGELCEHSQNNGNGHTPAVPSPTAHTIPAINACGDVLTSITRLEESLSMSDVPMDREIWDRFFEVSSQLKNLVSDMVQRLAK